MRLKSILAKKKHLCRVCGAKVAAFKPYRGGLAGLPPICIGLEVVGSDVENFSCPACGSHDRERHLHLYFDALGLWEALKGKAILHFAPERHLGAKLKEIAGNYVAGDLFPSAEGVMKLDVTAIPFGEGAFDAILCNHVLEHVPDDAKALSELFRVLRPGGFAILQTPFTPLLSHSIEDPSVVTDEARLKVYGQEDHIRLYGTDLFERIRGAGFDLSVKRHADLFEPGAAALHGVNEREDLIMAVKAG